MSSFDPNKWAREKKAKMERAKILRAQRLRAQRARQAEAERLAAAKAARQRDLNPPPPQAVQAPPPEPVQAPPKEVDLRFDRDGLDRFGNPLPKRGPGGRRRRRGPPKKLVKPRPPQTDAYPPARGDGGLPRGSDRSGGIASLSDLFQQAKMTMDSIDRLSTLHEQQFSGRREAAAPRREPGGLSGYNSITPYTPEHRRRDERAFPSPPGSTQERTRGLGQAQRGFGAAVADRERKAGRGRRGGAGKPPAGSAAQSHQKNDQYMADWHKAYQGMSGGRGGGAGSDGVVQLGPDTDATPKRARRPGVKARATRRKPSNVLGRLNDRSRVRRGGGVHAGGEALPQDTITRARVSGLRRAWYSDPSRRKPVSIDSSGRPILCMSVHGDEAVVGSSDHALYGYDLTTGAQTRQLYNRRNGHSEWVTCVCHTADGRVVSGGMDSRVLIWGARGANAQELKGHTGSVSVVKATDNGHLVLSAGYDKTIRAWDLRSRRGIAVMQGHQAPVLALDWQPGMAVSGGRAGVAIAWDLNTAQPISKLSGHKGHVTVVHFLLAESNSLFLTGAQDGHVRVWDVRDRKAVANIAAHTSSRGAGALAGIESTPDGSTVVTAGADKNVCFLDPRAGFRVRARATDHPDFIYSLKVVDDVAITGGGRGDVFCHSVRDGTKLWRTKPVTNAVRAIGATPTALVVAGDDGNAVIYNMN